MEPYKQIELVEPNSIQKMLKINPPENALREFINILAVKSFSEVDHNDVNQINLKYKVNLASKFKIELLKIFEEFVNYYLSIDLPNDGSNFIPKFIQILGLEQNQADEMLSKKRREIFRERLYELLADKKLTDEDKNVIEKLSKDLDLSQTEIDKISEEVKSDVIHSFLNSIIDDGELSPEEDAELLELTKNLSVELEMDENTKLLLEKLRQIWRINHEPLPILLTDILLKKNEYCHYVQSVDWYENRVVRSGGSYGGVTGRVKIAKGIYFRYGNLDGKPRSRDELVKIDSGNVYLTNKRIIFVGEKKNVSIRIPQILDIKAYKNGVEIIKESGKSPFLEFTLNVDIFTAILRRIIMDSL